MSSRPPRIHDRLVGLTLGVFLLWRGAAAAVEIGTEVAANPPAARAFALTAAFERRLRRTLGPDTDLFRRVRDEVPADQPLFVVSPPSFGGDRPGRSAEVVARIVRLTSALDALLYPRDVIALPLGLDPALLEEYGGKKAPWVLDLDSRLPVPWEERFERVAADGPFALWKWRTEP